VSDGAATPETLDRAPSVDGASCREFVVEDASPLALSRFLAAAGVADLVEAVRELEVANPNVNLARLRQWTVLAVPRTWPVRLGLYHRVSSENPLGFEVVFEEKSTEQLALREMGLDR
jgi:hypothetical protein